MNELFHAVMSNDIVRYENLISSADVDLVDEYKGNLLHTAIAYANTAVGLDLIKRGIDVDHRDAKGLTPLHFCGLYKNVELATAILSNGGDPNVRDIHDNSALWTSVFNARGNNTIVKLLLTYGANAVLKNKYGRSPLDFARQIDDQELIKILEQ